MSLSDTLLQAGCCAHINAVHGETITVLSASSPDAGKSFQCVVELDADSVLQQAMQGTKDRRARRALHFIAPNPAPNLQPNDLIQTADGRKWEMVDDPQNDYLENHLCVQEVISKDAR